MSHFIICCSGSIIFGMPNGQASTQLLHAIQRGFSEEWTIPSSPFLIASAGQTCAQVGPADAIKKGEDGIVHSSLKPRCIACNNCVLACPFGIPKMMEPEQQMMKCDMCYDRTSVGKRPMCATVCPSQALSYVRPEEIASRREKPTNIFY